VEREEERKCEGGREKDKEGEWIERKKESVRGGERKTKRECEGEREREGGIHRGREGG
jgi:hypothetical protein